MSNSAWWSAVTGLPPSRGRYRRWFLTLVIMDSIWYTALALVLLYCALRWLVLAAAHLAYPARGRHVTALSQGRHRR